MNFKQRLAVSVAIASMIGVTAVTPSFVQTVQVEASDFEYTQDQQKVLQRVNEFRAKLNLQPVALNPFLNKAAENHVNYLNTNNLFEHDEYKDKKGFTGVTHGERLKAVGAPEDISFVTGEIMSSKDSLLGGVDGLITVPLHRATMMYENLRYIGSGFKDGILVINLSYYEYDIDTHDRYYPYDGQTGVPTYFTSSMETPNPLNPFGVNKTGSAITYMAMDYVEEEDMHAKIIDGKGNDVPFFLFGGGGTSFHFFPKNELKTNEKYTVSVSYKDVKGNTGSRTWSFTTASKSTPYLFDEVGYQKQLKELEQEKERWELSKPKPTGYIDPYGNPVDGIGNTTDNYYSSTRPKDDVAIRLDGNYLTNLNPKPVIRNGTTLVPLRGVLEKMDAEVIWNQAKKEIKVNSPNTQIKLYLNQKYAYREGNKVTLSQAPTLIGSSTYVPLRFLSENLGATVGWDNKNRIVDITLN